MTLRNRDGFTLVELILTVSVIAFMGSVAVYSFTPFLQSRRLDQAVTLLVGAVREAQIRAVREGRAWRVLVDTAGTGYSLQYYGSTGEAPQDCTDAGWTTRKAESLPPGYALDAAHATRRCITFAATGRADWQNPHVVIDPAVTDSPNFGGDLNVLRLTDGVELTPHDCTNLPTDPRYDWRTVSWYNKSPRVLFDVGDARLFDAIELGLYTNLPRYKYPTTVIVQGTSEVDSQMFPPQPPSGAAWTTLYNGPGPTEVPRCDAGKMDVTWFKVPVHGSYRFFRVTLKHNTINQYVILHEIRIANTLNLQIKGYDRSKQLTISPVTGRVTVR